MTYAATPYLPTMTSAWRPRPPSWRDMQMWGQMGRSRHRLHDTRRPEPCRLDHTQPNAVQPPAFLSAVIKRKAGLSSRISGRIADQRTECSLCPVHELLHEDRRDVRRLTRAAGASPAITFRDQVGRLRAVSGDRQHLRLARHRDHVRASRLTIDVLKPEELKRTTRRGWRPHLLFESLVAPHGRSVDPERTPVVPSQLS